MRVSHAVSFLTGVMEQEGDIKIECVTGCWVNENPKTGEKVVVFAVGNGKSIADALNETS